MARTLLTNPEVEHLLASLPEWNLIGKNRSIDATSAHKVTPDDDGLLATNSSIQADYEFESYAQGVAFVVAVALRAETQDHHPTILLKWGSVSIRTTTHDTHGLTAHDVTLAFAIRTLADGMGGTARKQAPAL